MHKLFSLSTYLTKISKNSAKSENFLLTRNSTYKRVNVALTFAAARQKRAAQHNSGAIQHHLIVLGYLLLNANCKTKHIKMNTMPNQPSAVTTSPSTAMANTVATTGSNNVMSVALLAGTKPKPYPNAR